MWLSGFIVVCNIFPFILKSPSPPKICVLIIPSPWTCYDTLCLSVEFFYSFPIIWNKQCCIDCVNRIVATVYWMMNRYKHTQTIWLHCHYIIQIASRVLNIMLTRYHNFPTAVIPTVRLHVHIRRLVEEGKLEVSLSAILQHNFCTSEFYYDSINYIGGYKNCKVISMLLCDSCS